MTRISYTEGYSDKSVIKQIFDLKRDKQDTLVAGENITIEDNVISATGGGSGDVTKAYVDQQIATRQPVGDYATNTRVNQVEAEIPDVSGLATKAEVQAVEAEIPDVSGLATKTEVNTGLAGKQATLVSGTNIKTINNQSLLGSGNIDIQAGGTPQWGDITGTLSNQTDLANALASKADSADLATVATTGSYNDLSDKPTIPTALSQLSQDATHRVVTDTEKSTWNGKQAALTFDTTPVSGSNNPVTSGGVYTALDAKANAADLATVATSGSYNDLSDKPTIPAAQVNSDWNATSGKAQILNKPTLATVATSGSYNDLSNKPTIPTALSQLTADSTHRLVTDTEKSTWNGKQTALVSGTNIKTINNQSLLGSGNISISGGSSTWGGITGTLSDQTDLQTALDAKQATLVSGTNIKTINNQSLLGSGNIDIQGGGSGGYTPLLTGVTEFPPFEVTGEVSMTYTITPRFARGKMVPVYETIGDSTVHHLSIDASSVYTIDGDTEYWGRAVLTGANIQSAIESAMNTYLPTEQWIPSGYVMTATFHVMVSDETDGTTPKRIGTYYASSTNTIATITYNDIHQQSNGSYYFFSPLTVDSYVYAPYGSKIFLNFSEWGLKPWGGGGGN